MSLSNRRQSTGSVSCTKSSSPNLAFCCWLLTSSSVRGSVAWCSEYPPFPAEQASSHVLQYSYYCNTSIPHLQPQSTSHCIPVAPTSMLVPEYTCTYTCTGTSNVSSSRYTCTSMAILVPCYQYRYGKQGNNQQTASQTT